MKHFTYTDINGRTQYGTIYDNTSKVDCSNIHLHADESCFSRPVCVLGYHIKLKKHGTSKMHLYCNSIYFYGRNKCDMHCCHADTAFFIATARPLNCY